MSPPTGRRAMNSTDESLFSVTSSLVEDAAVARIFLSSNDLQSLDATAILSRSLSVRSVISTTSSFAAIWQGVSSNPDSCRFQHIGNGLQGTVYELTGTDKVVKIAISNSLGSLRDEWRIHNKVFQAFAKYNHLSAGVVVIKPLAFIEKSTQEGETWWNEQGHRFSQGQQSPQDIFIMERVFPLPKVVRHALVEKFIPASHEHTAEAVKSNPRQKHALARVYLGRPSGPYLRPAAISGTEFSLRNFPLYHDAIRTLGLDGEGLAIAMARAYAIMHWAAGTSGADVEFVLGTKAVTSQQLANFQHRSVHLFLIDFGQCQGINRVSSMQNFLIIGRAVLNNDPYIPVPGTRLWQSFRDAYVNTSRTILREERLDGTLGMRVMARIEEHYESI